jgi:hypothetical protein
MDGENNERTAVIAGICGSLDVAVAWLRMDEAIERSEYRSMVARETDDPFWDELARQSALVAARLVAAYEDAVGRMLV